MTGEKDRFRRILGAVATRAQLGDDANASPGKRLLALQRMWVQRAVCRLLAQNVSSLAVIVGPSLRLLAQNVSRKRPLFAGPSATVCRLLQLNRSTEDWHSKVRLFYTGDDHISTCPGDPAMPKSTVVEMPTEEQAEMLAARRRARYG